MDSKKEKKLSVRVSEELYKELDSHAKLHNCTISEVVTSKIRNGSDSSLDKKSIYKAVMNVTTLLEQEDRRNSLFDSSKIREELMEICILLNS